MGKKKLSKKPLSYKMLCFLGYCLAEARYILSYENLIETFELIFGTKYNITTLRKEFSNLKKEGLIEFKTRYRKPYPVLSQKGKLAIKTHLPFKRYGPWDGKWRLVIFDIPEVDRSYRWAMRHKLAELGFGQIQKSAYISPYPLLGTISRYASELGVRQYLRLLEVQKIDNENQLIDDVWHLKEINEDYKSFIIKTKREKHQTFWPLRAKILEQEFAEIYEKDPHLPEKFLPAGWRGKEAYDIFKAISNSY